MGSASEEVKMEIRGRDRLVTHPRLDRSGVDATRQPQALAHPGVEAAGADTELLDGLFDLLA
jgi:hypothetical protein